MNEVRTILQTVGIVYCSVLGVMGLALVLANKISQTSCQICGIPIRNRDIEQGKATLHRCEDHLEV